MRLSTLGMIAGSALAMLISGTAFAHDDHAIEHWRERRIHSSEHRAAEDRHAEFHRQQAMENEWEHEVFGQWSPIHEYQHWRQELEHERFHRREARRHTAEHRDLRDRHEAYHEDWQP